LNQSGCKRETPIWDYYKYDALADKRYCTAASADHKRCPPLTGKNLKVHLKTSHPEAFAQFEKAQTSLMSRKAAPKTPAAKTAGSLSPQPSIAAFVKVRKSSQKLACRVTRPFFVTMLSQT